ncbi:Hypothetical predicted protein [Paramuricea clavata]|uniref:Uncharacterized protein n=1 Tax=Paramuricea clavata TaxID=317549 RepID=A0A6S7L242_PARCT|nr:Hypothetical predicted protein [Paramuricea clavata]
MGGNNAVHTVSDGTTTFFFHFIPRAASKELPSFLPSFRTRSKALPSSAVSFLYFYNYLDELAMDLCASIPAEGQGLNYAVRRTCGKHEYSRATKYVRTEA